jgi:hypothetical protein
MLLTIPNAGKDPDSITTAIARLFHGGNGSSWVVVATKTKAPTIGAARTPAASHARRRIDVHALTYGSGGAEVGTRDVTGTGRSYRVSRPAERSHPSMERA